MPKVKPETSLARRDEILEAAEICFARQGFHQTTIRDVIRESGLSAGCIYGHFATKEDIIHAMGERRHARDAMLLSPRDESMDPIATLRAVAREFLMDLQKEDGLRIRKVGLQLWAEALRSKEVHSQVIAGVHVPISTIIKLLQRGQRLGTVSKKIDPAIIARTIVSMAQGFVLQRVWGEPFEAAAALQGFDTLLRGLAPDARR
ncbi:TetR/AcrR family transcriptional regulator [Bradyrhizobium canariense]|uniref:Transcriptional regulator, TetR family n=1 Tax=Bradyrhizobium canariense TaxID=255045 RepID=A0A1H1VMI0_9BRAD|nr:TetR/AcrR family transcriptional regulator [Bradyrhizobium canariense]SDS85933.1 transcriptional regulator, TetR family [Bradyrhizobium canariense]